MDGIGKAICRHTVAVAAEYLAESQPPTRLSTPQRMVDVALFLACKIEEVMWCGVGGITNVERAAKGDDLCDHHGVKKTDATA